MHSPALPFKILAWVVIVAAGFVAAAVASSATQPMVWMVAYLVLIAGAAQHALGTGLAALAQPAPSCTTTWSQWVLLNLGHAGVVGGTLAASAPVLLLGTVLYDVAVLWLGWTVRAGCRRPAGIAYWVLVVVLVLASFVGLALSSLL